MLYYVTMCIWEQVGQLFGGFGIGGKPSCTRQATTLLKGTVSKDGYFLLAS
jgi:hypothetical protein